MKPILTPGREQIAVNIMSGIGLAPEEKFPIEEQSAGGFRNGRVVAYNEADFHSQGRAISGWDNQGNPILIAVNAGQFESNAPSTFLSSYAVRYTDPLQQTLDELRQFLAPDVASPRFAQYPVYSLSDAYLSLDVIEDDVRAIGADFATVRNQGKNLTAQKVPNRGLAIEVDEEEELLDTDWQQRKVALIRGILDRTRLRRAINLAVAAAVNVNKTWNATVGQDPDQDIMDEIDNLIIRPTRAIIGPGAWSRRVRTHRAQATAQGFASAPMSVEDLAGYFALDGIQVPRHRYASGSAALTNVVGSQVLLFIAMDGMSRDDFSNLKTFWCPTKTGQRYATYVRQVGDKRWRFAVEAYDLVALTSAIGLEVMTIS